MANVRYTFVNASAPFVPPARAWCCGVVEGEICARPCPRLAVYGSIERAAVDAVVLRTGKDREFVSAAARRWSTQGEYDTSNEVWAEAVRIRKERGICEHYAPDRRSCPECLGPAGRERMRAEELRKENRRVGEEIARNPPAWAYPLGWRLAVMAEVELANNRSDPSRLSLPQMREVLTDCLRAFHAERLQGVTFERCMAGQIGETTIAVCTAYERGRPGPGGVSITPPAAARR